MERLNKIELIGRVGVVQMAVVESEESNTPETLNGIPISEDREVKVDWDIDDPEGEEGADELPETVLVPRYVPDEDVADYLSDIWGFCINSWYEV